MGRPGRAPCRAHGSETRIARRRRVVPVHGGGPAAPGLQVTRPANGQLRRMFLTLVS